MPDSLNNSQVTNRETDGNGKKFIVLNKRILRNCVDNTYRKYEYLYAVVRFM